MRPNDREVVFSSASVEHRTPTNLFRLLNYEEGPFTLDPAATRANALCPTYYTKRENGLLQPWFGRVYCNPPYGVGDLNEWITKAVTETAPSDKYDPKEPRAECVWMLLPARTDRRIFHTHVSYFADEIRFLVGRLKFSDQKDSAPFPSCLVKFKPRSVKDGPGERRVWWWDWRTMFTFREGEINAWEEKLEKSS